MTFPTPYRDAPICVANDTTSASSGIKPTSAATNVTFSGTGTDSIAYICVGNRTKVIERFQHFVSRLSAGGTAPSIRTAGPNAGGETIVTFRTERNEVLQGNTSERTAKLQMMNLQFTPATAILTSPAIPV